MSKLETLTFILVAGGHSENRVLDILILIHFGLIQILVKVWRVVVLIRDADSNELGH